MADFDTPQLVAIAAALGFASGLRLYGVLFIVGLAGALGYVDLPPGLQLLQHPGQSMPGTESVTVRSVAQAGFAERVNARRAAGKLA